MVQPQDIIKLSPRAFWDIDMSRLDYDKQADYIIRKVFDYGTLDDVLEVIAYYGREKVKQVLINADFLRESTRYYASLLFNIPLESFKCYTTKQYQPIH